MIKRCKYYEICGYEDDAATLWPKRISSKGTVYFGNKCSLCYKKWNSAHRKKHYNKNKRATLDQQKEYRQNHPNWQEYSKKYGIEYRSTHKYKYKHEIYMQTFWEKPERRFKRAIKIAAKRGITWVLSLDDFIRISNQPCYYCSNKFCQPVKVGSGLDRLDNTKGYEADNVVPCGKNCNQLRMDVLTPEETKAAIAAILLLRENATFITPGEAATACQPTRYLPVPH